MKLQPPFWPGKTFLNSNTDNIQDDLGIQSVLRVWAQTCGKEWSLVLLLRWCTYCLWFCVDFVLASSKTTHGNTLQKLRVGACLWCGTLTQVLIRVSPRTLTFHSVYLSFILQDVWKHNKISPPHPVKSVGFSFGNGWFHSFLFKPWLTFLQEENSSQFPILGIISFLWSIRIRATSGKKKLSHGSLVF